MLSDRKQIASTLIVLWAAAATVFHLYTAYIGYLEPRIQRSLHLLFLLPLAFLLYPTFASKDAEAPRRPSWLDWGLAILVAIPCLYSYLEADRINLRLEDVDPLLTLERVMGTIMIVLVLDALRRAVSPVMAGLVTLGLAYLLLTEYMPGFWNYRDIAFDEIVKTMYVVNGHGIFGAITGISATMVAVFIAFGAFIETSGAGRLFTSIYGVPVLGAHLFVFYFAILADATPLVSIASYAAASIARTNPIATGFQAARIAIAGYIVGYSYIFVPELRLEGEPLTIIGNFIVIAGGLTLVAAGLTGYFSDRLNILLRLLVIPVGLALALYQGYPLWLRVIVVLLALAFLYLAPRLTGSARAAVEPKAGHD